MVVWCVSCVCVIEFPHSKTVFVVIPKKAWLAPAQPAFGKTWVNNRTVRALSSDYILIKIIWAVSWENVPLHLCDCHTQRRIGGLGPSNPSLGMTPTIKLYSVAVTEYILYLVSYQKKDWRGPSQPFLFWYDKDKNLKVCFPMAQLILKILRPVSAWYGPYHFEGHLEKCQCFGNKLLY